MTLLGWIASFPGDDRKRRSFLAKHFPQVTSQHIRGLKRGKVTPLLVFRFEYNVSQRLGPSITNTR